MRAHVYADCKSVGLHLRRRLVPPPEVNDHAQYTATTPLASRSCRSCTPTNLPLLRSLAQDGPPSGHEQPSRIDLSPNGPWRRSKFGEPPFILRSDAYVPSRQN